MPEASLRYAKGVIWCLCHDTLATVIFDAGSEWCLINNCQCALGRSSGDWLINIKTFRDISLNLIQDLIVSVTSLPQKLFFCVTGLILCPFFIFSIRMLLYWSSFVTSKVCGMQDAKEKKLCRWDWVWTTMVLVLKLHRITNIYTISS